MSRYSILFPVYPRMEGEFSREEIELAARVCFFQHPPAEATVTSSREHLDLQWSDMLLPPHGAKLIRVVGEVQE